MVNQIGLALAGFSALLVALRNPQKPLTSAAMARLTALLGVWLYFSTWAPLIGSALFGGGLLAGLALWCLPGAGSRREPAAPEVLELVAWLWMLLACSKILL